MNNIFEKSIAKSFSYQEYRNIVANYANEGKTTGENTEDHIKYTKLNEARLHRLDKTIKMNDEVLSFLKNLKKQFVWLVISESWCGDAAQILPVLNKMAEVSDKIELKIVLRDENEELMNLFLTNGTKSIPKLIIIDKETLDVVNDFGPRPIGAKNLISDYKAEHGVIDETAKIELQKWYLADKGISIQQEIVKLME